LYESQLFQNDALDRQSLLLLFNSHDNIPKNELMFLFRNEYDWHNLLVLPDRMTIKNNNQRHESALLATDSIARNLWANNTIGL
jgi:hypothetical protein